MTQGVGLSIGATNFAAVAAGRVAVTRRPVLTLYRHRPPEIGVPWENPRLDERGLVVGDFVDRAADPMGIVAADGSFHRGEVLVAQALLALSRAGVDDRNPEQPPGVAFPAHWRIAAVDAVRRELTRQTDWSADRESLTLIPDAAAALTALQAEPGLPTRGVVALCDFGGSGTSITLADAAEGYRQIGASVRHADLSGEFIDRALLTRVIADLSITGSARVAGTAAIGSLHRLRAQCRKAKERLSRGAVATLFADVPGYRGEIRLTRSELDDELRRPLTTFIEVLREHLLRNGISNGDLAAIASVGGGANIPVVTTTLSEQFRVPVITAPRPELVAARGAALRSMRPREAHSATGVGIRPLVDVSHGERPHRREPKAEAWYRPLLVTVGTFAVMVLVGTGAVMAIRNDANSMSGTTSATTDPGRPGSPAAAVPPPERPLAQDQGGSR